LVFEGYVEGVVTLSKSNDLVLRADCEDGDQDIFRRSASWHLSEIYANGTAVPLTLPQQERMIEDLHSKDLLLTSGFLGSLPNAILLNVCFRLNISSQNIDACRRLAFSSPPNIIECLTNASSQVELYEIIWIKCKVLLVEENDATEFRVDGQSRVTLATAYTPTIFVTLPFSKKAQDVCFRVTDRFFAYDEKCVATVQVIAPTSKQIYDKLQTLVNESDNLLEEILRTGDPNEIANMISSLAPVQAELSYGHFEGEASKALSHSSAKRIVGLLVSALVTLPIVDAGSLVQTASSAAMIASCGRDMPGHSQIELINYLSILAQGLDQAADSTPRDDLMNVVKQFSMLSIYMFEGFNVQFTSPLPIDEDISLSEVDYDADIDGPGKPIKYHIYFSFFFFFFFLFFFFFFFF
uniref:REJ domain-containing protein n=1 Tax=Schistocephalus solidus TaxID=70667 RepID=A0A183SZ26_SCHSO